LGQAQKYGGVKPVNGTLLIIGSPSKGHTNDKKNLHINVSTKMSGILHISIRNTKTPVNQKENQ